MLQTFWDNFWKDKHGNVVIWQKPNLWLIAWFVFVVIAMFSYGGFSHVFSWLATGAIVIWALLEIVQGATYFRRTLGVLVLLASLSSAFGIGL
jgi:hypothetical protein